MNWNCPKCGTIVDCGANQPEACWCADYPSVLPLTEGVDACYCPRCLKEEVINNINMYVSEIKSGKRDNDTAKYATPRLQEGIDYYLENELFVLTEWYYLKRGRCCGNGCRHCPYDHENVPKKRK